VRYQIFYIRPTLLFHAQGDKQRKTDRHREQKIQLRMRFRWTPRSMTLDDLQPL